MTFLNFSLLPESVFPPKFSGKHFPENQTKFFFNWKVLSVDWKMFFIDQLYRRQINIGKFGK